MDQNTLLRFAAFHTIFILLFMIGCALPGSSWGTVRLAGKSNNPLEESLTVKVKLPASYGISNTDRLTGDPEDFGHETRIKEIQIGNKNQFTTSFDIIYHVNICLLPPLGAFPSTPPTPTFYLQFSNAPEEIYVVPYGNSYEVRNVSTSKRITHLKASWLIQGIEIINESESEKTVHIRFKQNY